MIDDAHKVWLSDSPPKRANRVVTLPLGAKSGRSCTQ